MEVRQLKHPGPISPTRVFGGEGALNTVEIQLQKGDTLIDSISKVLEPMHVKGAGIRFKNLQLAPVSYVMPTYSPDSEHVAYYSETHILKGGICVEYANATYGIRENVPFMHFHGLWKEGETQRGGHVLPAASIIAEDSIALAYCTLSVEVNSVFDAETNFTIFTPIQTSEPGCDDSQSKCVIATIKPNMDLLETVESICKNYGLSSATIRSGVGSTIGCVFESGAIVEEIPTELVVLDGTVSLDGAGNHKAEIEAALIDANGKIHTGKLRKGQNPVLILFELIITSN